MKNQEAPATKREGDREEHLPLFAQQIRLLYRFSLVEYLATLLVTFILGAILWDDLTRPTLFAWFVAISLVTIARYIKAEMDKFHPVIKAAGLEGSQ